LKDKDIITKLISTSKRDQSQALDQLYVILKPILISVVKKFKQVDADEILQDGVIAFYNNLVIEKKIPLNNDNEIINKDSRVTKISSYMYSVFYNKCMEQSRKNNWSTSIDDISPSKEELVEIEDFEKEENQKDVKMKQLISNLSKLGKQCQEILKLFWFENLRHDEIASRMNLSNAKTSKATKSRCQNKLKELTIHVN